MEKTTTSKTGDSSALRQRTNATNDADGDNAQRELPPDVAEVKAKLEAKTGKKYKYRPPVKEMTVPHLLMHGTDRPRTWMDSYGYPIILALIFLASLIIFHHALPARTRPPFTLPKGPVLKLHNSQQRGVQAQHQKTEP